MPSGPGGHAHFWDTNKNKLVSPLDPWHTSLSSCREGQYLVVWFFSHIPQTSMLSRGHSHRQCFLQHLEKMMSNAKSSSSLFLLACNVSSWELSMIRISVLNLSNMLPILSLVTPPPLDHLVTFQTMSQSPLLGL